MMINKDSTYKTRGGDTVTIIDVDYSYSMPFFGHIERNGEYIRPASYNAAGQYKNGTGTEWDIVEQLSH
jgi:hypothetical protein